MKNEKNECLNDLKGLEQRKVTDDSELDAMRNISEFEIE